MFAFSEYNIRNMSVEGQIYGSSRNIGKDLPKTTLKDGPYLSDFPSPDARTPVRRRTIICSNLTIEGQTWNLEEAKAKMWEALRGNKANIRCDKRPGIQIASDYALDVCLSSWCRNCPFLPSSSN